MTRFKLIIVGALFIGTSSAVSSQEIDLGEDVMEQVSEAVSDSISNLQVLETNGFQVKSSRNKELGVDLQPNGNEIQLLNVKADDIFQVIIEKGRPMSKGGGVAVFHRVSGVPMLSAGDRDGDGRIDSITYGVVDARGVHILDVIDYEADGQADLRVNIGEGYFEIWHEDRWYRAEDRHGVRGIVVDGSFREIQNIDNRPVVQ